MWILVIDRSGSAVFSVFPEHEFLTTVIVSAKDLVPSLLLSPYKNDLVRGAGPIREVEHEPVAFLP